MCFGLRFGWIFTERLTYGRFIIWLSSSFGTHCSKFILPIFFHSIWKGSSFSLQNINIQKFFFYSLPKLKKNYPKKGTTFFIFQNFHCRLYSLFGDKKVFFVTKNQVNSAAKTSKNKKSCPLFGVSGDNVIDTPLFFCPARSAGKVSWGFP
jgi:hypothetical protein